MNDNGRRKPLPQWIWHKDKDRKRVTEIATTIMLEREVSGAGLFAAFTGSAAVEFDGVEISVIGEQPGNVAGFRRIEGLPERIAAGKHELRFRLSCTELVPIAPVNAYLNDRRVGFIAFLSNEDDVWYATDGTWLADGEGAAPVCLLGEEPFGDLENSPDWFVAGGFGDIGVYPLADFRVADSQGFKAVTDAKELSISGPMAGECALRKPNHLQLELFYHLRKQGEWKEMRAMQHELVPGQAPSVTVDLAKEYNARFTVHNLGDEGISVLWNGAESLHELEHYNGCITEWFELAAWQAFTTLPQGMRYVRLVALGPAGKQADLRISFEAANVELRRVGSLEADKPLLNDIYDVSAHTSLICHQIGLWDGVKRDRLNWTFDFYLAAKSCYFLWDDYEVLRRAVRELGAGTPYGYWMNGIAEYTLWWIKTVCEYYYYTGDKTFVLEMGDVLKRHIGWVEANIDPATGMMDVSEGILIEWVPMTEEELRISLHAILKLTRDDLVRLAADVPELDMRVSWTIPELDEARFMREDNVLATKALGIASGYVSEAAARAFLQSYELKDPLTPISAFMYAECCSKFGLHEQAYRAVSVVWGDMLTHGATTFWESFTLSFDGADYHRPLTTYRAYDSYRMSLCHAWSSTPVKWISEYVLGVQCAEPGFKSIRFAPAAVGDLTSCKGKVNTPFGAVEVEWSLNPQGELKSSIRVPEGITVL